MEERRHLRFCGAPVGAPELEMIKAIVRDCSGLSRTELAQTVCELLEWWRANGSLKAHECRLFLEELATRGIMRLPGRRTTMGRAKASEPGKLPDSAAETLQASLSELSGMELDLVRTEEDRRQWREWVGRYHWLGYKVPFGAHLRYFVRMKQRVGCLQISSPAWRMAVRDRWIGWEEAERLRGLQRIVQNSRFLILPEVRVPNLASAALARMVRRVPLDWQGRYGIRPLLMETLVDPARFRGTCYRAANWIHLGRTTGRGRMDRNHERHGASPKEVFVYPLCHKAREKLREV
jgi:hypothetical protein